MSGRRRMVLGRYGDVRESTATMRCTSSYIHSETGSGPGWGAVMHSLVEVARYHLGNDYARVAYAYLHRKNW